jgi:hypothetical protein
MDPREAGYDVSDDQYDVYEWERLDLGWWLLEKAGYHTWKFDPMKNWRFKASIWADCDQNGEFETLIFDMTEPWEFMNMDIQPPWFYHEPQLMNGPDAAGFVQSIINTMSQYGDIISIFGEDWAHFIEALEMKPCGEFVVATCADWEDGEDGQPGDINKKRSLGCEGSWGIDCMWYNPKTTDIVYTYDGGGGDLPMVLLAFIAVVDFYPLAPNEWVADWPDPRGLKNDGSAINEGELIIFDFTYEAIRRRPGEDFILKGLKVRIEDWMMSINPDPYQQHIEPDNGNWHRSKDLGNPFGLPKIEPHDLDFSEYYNPQWHIVHYPEANSGVGEIHFDNNCASYISIFVDQYFPLDPEIDTWGENPNDPAIEFREGVESWQDLIRMHPYDWDLDNDGIIGNDYTCIFAAVKGPDTEEPIFDVQDYDGTGGRFGAPPSEDEQYVDVNQILNYPLNEIGEYIIQWDGRQNYFGHVNDDYLPPPVSPEPGIPMFLPPGQYILKMVVKDELKVGYEYFIPAQPQSGPPETIRIAYPAGLILKPDSAPGNDIDNVENCLASHGICFTRLDGYQQGIPAVYPKHDEYRDYESAFFPGLGYGGFYPYNYNTFAPFHSVFAYFGHATNIGWVMLDLDDPNYENMSDYWSQQFNKYDLVLIRACHSWEFRKHFNYNVFIGWESNDVTAMAIAWTAKYFDNLNNGMNFLEAHIQTNCDIDYDWLSWIADVLRGADYEGEYGKIDFRNPDWAEYNIDDISNCLNN